ncbi:MAG: trypsin-like serine protease, partial [Desulfonatronovibrio sp.]
MVKNWLRKIILFLVAAGFLAFLAPTPEAVSGDRFPGRIIGGHEAAQGAWPWIAYLDIESNGEEYQCGASLISPEWMITAAHCTMDADSITAIMGRHN